MSSVKVQNDFKDVNGVFAKVNGQWKTVTESYTKVNDEWKLTTFSTGPEDAPEMTHDGFGKFRIVNYDPNLVYEAEYESGNTGSVSLSGDTFTLGSTQVAYNVYSRFVANGPQSPAGYMERKRITFTPETVTIPKTCSREINEDYAASPIYGTITGDLSNCAPYPCLGQISGPDGLNRCFCTGGGTTVLLGGGICPAGWFNCGNRCCIGNQIVGYSCPNGGTLSGTTCIKRRIEYYDCSYTETRYNENPVPSGYNRSPGTANVQGEWWRTTR